MHVLSEIWDGADQEETIGSPRNAAPRPSRSRRGARITNPTGSFEASATMPSYHARSSVG